MRKEVERIARELKDNAEDFAKPITYFQALQIAVQIQRNTIFASAFVINDLGQPVALEKIAMELERIAFKD